MIMSAGLRHGNKKRMYTAFKMILFIAVAAGVTAVMNYLYFDDTDEFSRHMMHEYYEQEENIDRLYLGSSHVFCDINPSILDEMNGKNNFNMASGTQQLITSYYLLKEADRKHELDRVYVDMYYGCSVAGLGNLHDYHMIPYSWIVLDQMKPSLNKLTYMMDLSKPQYYYLTLIPFLRYKEQLFDKEHVCRVITAKQSDIWKNYEYRHPMTVEGTQYIMRNGKKGFMLYDGTVESGGFYDTVHEEPLAEDPMTPEVLDYLVRIIEYCEKNEIPLTLINCPVADFQLAGTGGYDNYVSQIAGLAEQYGVAYYDFNLCKSEYLDLSDKKYWFDKGHLNTAGAEVYTRFLGAFLMAQEAGEDTYRDCFYAGYDDKIHAAENTIYGLEVTAVSELPYAVAGREAEDENPYSAYMIRPVTNVPDAEIDICVSTVEADGEKDGTAVEVIREGKDGYVIFPADEHGTMRVEAKLRSMAEASNYAVVAY